VYLNERCFNRSMNLVNNGRETSENNLLLQSLSLSHTHTHTHTRYIHKELLNVITPDSRFQN